MISVRHVELHASGSSVEESPKQVSLVKLPDPVPRPYTCAIVVLTGSVDPETDRRFALPRLQDRWVFWIEDQEQSQDIQWEFSSLSTAVHALVNHLNGSRRNWTSRFLATPGKIPRNDESSEAENWAEWEHALGWSHRLN